MRKCGCLREPMCESSLFPGRGGPRLLLEPAGPAREWHRERGVGLARRFGLAQPTAGAEATPMGDPDERVPVPH